MAGKIEIKCIIYKCVGEFKNRENFVKKECRKKQSIKTKEKRQEEEIH